MASTFKGFNWLKCSSDVLLKTGEFQSLSILDRVEQFSHICIKLPASQCVGNLAPLLTLLNLCRTEIPLNFSEVDTIIIRVLNK